MKDASHFHITMSKNTLKAFLLHSQTIFYGIISHSAAMEKCSLDKNICIAYACIPCINVIKEKVKLCTIVFIKSF